MKQIISIIAVLTATLLSCNGNDDKADGYGNFEATETTVSSEANGKLLTFTAEEGKVLEQGIVVGVINTVQLSF